MNRARVRDEIDPGPRIPSEELGREQIAFQSVTTPAGEYQVARRVRSTVRQRVHVVERREIELEKRGAVDAAPSAVAHGGALDRAFLVSGGNLLGAARSAWNAGERYTVKLPTS